MTTIKSKAKKMCLSVIKQEGIKVNGKLKKGYKYLKGGKIVKVKAKVKAKTKTSKKEK